MKRVALLALCCAGLSSAAPGTPSRPAPSTPAAPAPRLPSAPGRFAPSLVQITETPRGSGAVTMGTQLSDVDSCATCHPAAAAQWAASAHSFASFGNPIYRVNVELLRAQLGTGASRHCGGCHDMPLLVDGLMSGKIPAADLRAHSGVTCSLCHGVKSVTSDGNGSYVWSSAPIDAPVMSDPASIARHRAQVSVKALGAELCVGCHRGFLSPDLGVPVHLGGVDEPTAWRSSAWTGNGAGRIDDVPKQTCIDCHMAREAAGSDEYAATDGTIASHRFLGGHTWMAAMRGDADQVARLQAKLVGTASIDVGGALVDGQWHVPADGAPIRPGARASVDVVIRNLLAGHRFPGGVLDIQDTWIEVELADATGKRLAASGLGHATDPNDTEAHVLRTLVVDEHGEVLEHHELPAFRTSIATQTLAPREAQAIRYAFDVPKDAPLPLTVTARLRHRSRTLAMQGEACRAAKTPEGQAFIRGAVGARYVHLDPCRPQPITLIAQTSVQLGAGAASSSARPAWERAYELGMALVGTVTERLGEANAVLAIALAEAPEAIDSSRAAPPPQRPASPAEAIDSSRAAPPPRAMILAQLAQVASKQGRVDDALALVTAARMYFVKVPSLGALLRGEVSIAHVGPAVLDAIEADALMRVWRWDEAVAPARAVVQKAPGNTVAWVMLARCLGSLGDNTGALDAATRGLAIAPRDPDLLRSQATALAALGSPAAPAALAAYERFRSPDEATDLRIACAADSPRCAREREPDHSHVLEPVK